MMDEAEVGKALQFVAIATTATGSAMYCSECGQQVLSKFCTHCGTAAGTVPSAAPAELVPDWDEEVSYAAILQFPGVRDEIERHAGLATRSLTGEQFLALADKVVPLGVSLEGVAQVAQQLWTRLGVKTGKHRCQQVSSPFSRVLVRTLCSLARRGQSLRRVTQAADGCMLESALPSDLCSLQGELLVTLKKHGPGTEVRATAQIPGQIFDWGKSQRCLERLFGDLARDAA